AAPIEVGPVGLPGEGHAGELAVGGIAPAVVRAREDRRVAVVVAAHLHPAVTARVQKDVDAAPAVAAENDRFLAHRRGEEISGPRDLALVADEEPGAREDPLALLCVDLLAHEDLAADDPAVGIDQAVDAAVAELGHPSSPPGRWRARARP